MKILVVGAGGREHALAWKLAQSERIQMVYVAPGNGGTARDGRLVNVDLTDPAQLADFAVAEHIAFTVVGPEVPLAAGIVNLFRARGLKIFGPTREAAQLESSKDFAKSFMQRHGIPTAAYRTFSDVAEAHAYIDAQGAPIVVKADGLAAGKGVVVAMTLKEAHDAADLMLLDNRLGDAGARIVVEEFLAGEEASFIVMCDGKNILPLATSQDHKRLKDHDEGPNTGGMGAYSPAPIVTPEMHARVMREVINPTINGTLDAVELEWDRRTAVGVVMAAAGYPDSPRKGDVIDGIPPETPECVTFHAGTIVVDGVAAGALQTNGGRVLCVVGLGDSIKMAQRQAYETVDKIHFDGAQFRRDIGWRGLKH